MIISLSFLLKISITAILFCWCNDTPTFKLSPEGVHLQISLLMRVLVRCLIRHILLLFVYFFKDMSNVSCCRDMTEILLKAT